MAKSVVFLGHGINEQGIRPVKKKIRAIQEAPIPQKVSELKSYSGLLSPNMADVLAPQHALHGKEVKWRWSEREQKAFEAWKGLLTTDALPVHSTLTCH